jgi:predicted acyltransferase
MSGEIAAQPDSHGRARKAVEPARRIESLDEFRGYTIIGMLVVNFLGRYEAVPAILKHHNTYCSYADTIMPHFLFAVGFAYRLTWLRRSERLGVRAAYAHGVWRSLGLILLGIVVYGVDGGPRSWSGLRALGVFGALQRAFQREPFQALVHIGLTALWVTPVIAARPLLRLGFAAFSAGMSVMFARWFYFDWAWHRPVIDGGPLGFLTWTLPLIAGSLAYDAVVSLGARRAIAPLIGCGVLLMLAGQAMTALGGSGLAEAPFVAPGMDRAVDAWMMSQRTGSVSYLCFASGLSLVVYAGFVWLCDERRVSIGLLRTFGRNALAAYLLHDMVSRTVAKYTPKDAPWWYVLSALLVYLWINWVFTRALERREIFIRL